MMPLALLVLAACSKDNANDHVGLPKTPAPGVELATTDCDALRAAVVGSVAEAVVYARYGGFEIDDKIGGKSDETEGTEDEDLELESEPPPVETEDLVKLVGERMFVLSDRRLDVIELDETGKLTPLGYFGTGDGHTAVGMFADEDSAVLLHEVTTDAAEFGATRVTILSVEDPASPELVRQFDVEGEFEMARRQGDDVQLVTSAAWRVDREIWQLAYADSTSPELPEREPNATEERQDQLRDSARAEVEAAVEQMLPEMSELMPRLQLGGDDPTELHGCDAVYTTPRRGSVRVTTLTQFDPEAEAPTTLGVVGGSFAGAVHGDRFWAAFSEGWGANAGSTDLQGFKLDGEYLGSMHLDGTLVDEYSVSATDEEVHVITVSNKQTVLQRVPFEDEEIGEPNRATLSDDDVVVANRITSQAAYVATSGESDRIFAMSLGELELTGPYELGGVPSMIHALDDDRILVVAQQNNDDDEQVGVRVEVFGADAKPVSSAEIETGEFAAWSEAMWEPRSLAYAGDGLVAFPVNIEAWEGSEGANFSGVLLYDAAGDVARRGAIDHTDLRTARWCRQNDQADDCEAPQSNPWWTHVRRSVFVGDRIVTVSEAGMKVHDIEQLEELSSLVFD